MINKYTRTHFQCRLETARLSSNLTTHVRRALGFRRPKKGSTRQSPHGLALALGCLTRAVVTRWTWAEGVSGVDANPTSFSGGRGSARFKSLTHIEARPVVYPTLLPRDAVRKGGLCCRPVSVRHVRLLYPDG